MTVKRYKGVWLQIDTIDNRHIVKNTPEWEQKEVDAIVTALYFHGDKTKTNLNRMYHRRISESLKNIAESKKVPDYLIMNVLKDQIHDMWKYGFRKVEIKWNSDNTGEHETSWFTREKFLNLWAGNDKKGDDATEHQRFYFLYHFIKSIKQDLEGGFQSYVHDFYQRFWGVRSIAEHIKEVNEIYAKGKIKKEVYTGFIRRASELISLKAGTGEWTWKEPDLYKKVWAEYLFIRNIEKKNHNIDQVECYQVNCNEMIILSIKEYAMVLAGRGLNVKYCAEHNKRKKSD